MTRCLGCGILFDDNPRILAVHLWSSPRCLAAYNDHTIWHRGREIVYGSIHLEEYPSATYKWRIMGLDRCGEPHPLHAEKTRVKAQQWIETVNGRTK
jgi:hypothetical protein